MTYVSCIEFFLLTLHNITDKKQSCMTYFIVNSIKTQMSLQVNWHSCSIVNIIKLFNTKSTICVVWTQNAPIATYMLRKIELTHSAGHSYIVFVTESLDYAQNNFYKFAESTTDMYRYNCYNWSSMVHPYYIQWLLKLCISLYSHFLDLFQNN